MSDAHSGLVNLNGNVQGILPVVNGGTGLSSGTSGGVPYYSATGTIASTAALTSHAVMVGGGAGAAPTVVTNNATGTKNFLTQISSGTPAWGTIAGSDVPVAVPGTSNGGISSSGVPGNTSGTSIAASFVGETIYGPSNKATGSLLALSSGVVKNLQTLTLSSAGVWFITAQVQFNQGNNALVDTSELDFTVSSASASSMVGCNGNNACIDFQSIYPASVTGGSAFVISGGMLAFTFVATTGSQLWLNCQMSFSAGTANARGGFQAVRIA